MFFWKLVFVFALVCLPISADAAVELTQTLKRINGSSEINLGYRKNQTPMSFDQGYNKPAGYSVELCSRIAAAVKQKLGRSDIKINYVPVTAESRFDAIQSGKIDILCGATTKTLSRSEIVGFTQLTFVTVGALLSRKDAVVENVKGLEGKRVAVVSNTTTIGSLKGAVGVQEFAASSADRALAAAQAQQRATNDVLRVISHSPGDLEAIFDVILDYALQFSHSQPGIVWVYSDDGFNATGLKNVPAAFQEYLQAGTLSPGPKTGLGRMARQHRIIHIHDVRSEEAYREGDPLRQATADLGGARSFLAIPMIHRDNLIGAFTIYRQEVKPFTDDELSLLQAFSDQAAIALTITRLIDDRTKLLKDIENQTS